MIQNGWNIRANGDKFHYIDGQLHNNNGPARIDGGDKFWYQNGKLHRTDGPAIVRRDGSVSYYKHGQLHRTGGPAFVRNDGVKIYALDGIEFGSKEEFENNLSRMYPNIITLKRLSLLTFFVNLFKRTVK